MPHATWCCEWRQSCHICHACGATQKRRTRNRQCAAQDHIDWIRVTVGCHDSMVRYLTLGELGTVPAVSASGAEASKNSPQSNLPLVSAQCSHFAENMISMSSCASDDQISHDSGRWMAVTIYKSIIVQVHLKPTTLGSGKVWQLERLLYPQLL